MRWQNTEFVGSKHPNWKHGKSSYRQKQESKDEAKCRLCSENNSEVLVVHHIDMDRKNNISENLAWLCYNCHHLVHNHPRENDRLQNKVNHGDG